VLTVAFRMTSRCRTFRRRPHYCLCSLSLFGEKKAPLQMLCGPSQCTVAHNRARVAGKCGAPEGSDVQTFKTHRVASPLAPRFHGVCHNRYVFKRQLLYNERREISPNSKLLQRVALGVAHACFVLRSAALKKSVYLLLLLKSAITTY
jgi:hypothetical protein